MSDDQDFIVELRKDFLDEATFLLEQCEESYLKLENPEHRAEELAKIFRLAHSMKGGGSAVGFQDLANFAHEVEDCLSLLRSLPHRVTPKIISVLLQAGDTFKHRIQMLKAKDPSEWNIDAVRAAVTEVVKSLRSPETQAEDLGNALAELTVTEVASKAKSPELRVVESPVSDVPEAVPPNVKVSKPPANASPAANSQATAGSIKIDAERVENVLNIVGELVVIKSQLMNQTALYHQDLRLGSIVSLMDRTIRELQDRTLSMRMMPLRGLFLKTQRVVRDLSIKLAKPVEFSMSGEDTELDRTMVEMLADPLLHIARNSLDHGIEPLDRRRSAGKSEKGIIHLSARQMGSQVVIQIQDDGGGINRERVLQKAIEKGIVPPGRAPESLSDSEVFSFIFMPGFSTAAQVSDLSGRGVGMDVVKTNIEKLKGSVQVESTPGSGTTLRIAIPLTTSITDGMIVEVADRPYILPTDVIQELTTFDERGLVSLEHGQKAINHRGRVIPVIDLGSILPGQFLGQGKVTGKMLALVEFASKTVALRLDRVQGQTQVVLKTLGSGFEKVNGVAGVAILGDGKVALVLDPVGLVSHSVEAGRRQERAA